MVRKYFRVRRLPCFLLCIIFVLTFIHYKSSVNYINEKKLNHEELLSEINENIKKNSNDTLSQGHACKIPGLDVYDADLLKLLHDSPEKKCKNSEMWVVVSGNVAKISPWAKEKYGSIKCFFSEVIRRNDFEQVYETAIETNDEYNFTHSDVVRVICSNAYGKMWMNTLLGIRSDPEIFDRIGWSMVPEDSLKLNVLMFGFDSLSHNMWKRKLPRTYWYATKDLKGVALNGYNIVGDGALNAFVPLLTGKRVTELPEARGNEKDAEYVNEYPFIWDSFQENGYVTLFAEDQPLKGTFSFKLKGFKKQPVDHYIRTFFLEKRIFGTSEPGYCTYHSNYKSIIDYVKNVHNVYKDKPKFIFTFSSEFTHDNLNYTHTIDKKTVKFLQEIYESGVLNDTLLILFSDHGTRYPTFRKLQQGMQEERLPGFIFVFPKLFKQNYPEAYANFKLNANRLTTPFDVHEVLKNVLHFEGVGLGNIENRGISLFKEVPISRSCFDAGIEPHWCTCLDWETIPVSSSIIIDAALNLVNYINRLTMNYRQHCARVNLNKVFWSTKLLPNAYFINYLVSKNDTISKISISTEVYKIKVSLDPGNMLFEASLQYSKRKQTFSISKSEVKRVNAYHDMIDCIREDDSLDYLQPFCNCND